MLPALSSAVKGMQLNQSKIQQHADRISLLGLAESQNSSDQVDLATELTGVLQGRRAVEANQAVFKVTDEMLGTLIDVLA